MAQITHLAPADLAGAVLGGTNVVATGGRVVGPVVLGLVAAHAPPAAPFVAGAVVLLVAAVLAAALYPQRVRLAAAEATA
jgi:hypothetical protein